MRSLALTALLLAAASLLAQSNSSQVVLVAPPTSADCPVALSARWTAVGAVKQAGKGTPSSVPGYTIIFAPQNAHSITQAKLTLHGLNGAQVMPAKSAVSSNATEDFTVAPSATDNHRFETVVYAQKLTGVQWIEIDDLTFADGTHWQKSATSTCLVVPSGLRLINGVRPAH